MPEAASETDSDQSVSEVEEVLTMKTVRFLSHDILPSQKTYCSLDYEHEKQAALNDKMTI